jgi:hypothetical protein
MRRWRFLVVRDPKVKETVAALYKRTWDEQVAPRYRAGEPAPGMSRERFSAAARRGGVSGGAHSRGPGVESLPRGIRLEVNYNEDTQVHRGRFQSSANRAVSHADARSVQIGRHIVILVRISKNCRCLARTARSDGPIWSAGMG